MTPACDVFAVPWMPASTPIMPITARVLIYWRRPVTFAPFDGSCSVVGEHGFRWMGGCADGCTQSPKPPSDSCRGQFLWVTSLFPGQTEVVDESASKTELCVGGEDEPSPTIGLLGHAQRRCRPPERPLHEPEGVFDIEPAEVGPPAQVEIGFSFSGPPPPQRLLDAPCRLGQVLDLDSDDTTGDDRRLVTVPPASPTVQLRMQAVPGAHLHVPVSAGGGGGGAGGGGRGGARRP